MVEDPPASAGDMGFIPGPGRFHMPPGNSAPALTLEPMSRNYWCPRALEPKLLNKGSHRNEEPVHCS